MSSDRVALRPPTFDDVADERRHRKQRLTATLRLFGHHGFDEGLAGHVTVRDPEHPEMFWVNPLGAGFRRIRVKDLILVDKTGEVVEGGGALNRAAFAIHSRIHANRPDVVAAAHAHSIHGRAWSVLRRPLDPITQDACAFFEDHDVYADYTGAVLELDEGQRIASVLGSKKAVILANHGLLTVGQTSVDEAAWWFMLMERCCQVQLLAEAAGTVTHIDHDAARVAAGQTGAPGVGWRAFQPLYEWISSLEPDFLEE